MLCHTSRYLFNKDVVLWLNPSTGFPFVRAALSCFRTWDANDCIFQIANDVFKGGGGK